VEKEELSAGGNAVTAGGWIFLALSWGFIIALVAFCFYKVFSKKELD
jgi:glycerol uptake facilitator-like aquaporin